MVSEQRLQDAFPKYKYKPGCQVLVGVHVHGEKGYEQCQKQEYAEENFKYKGFRKSVVICQEHRIQRP